MPPKTKTAFQLDSPYCDAAWPQITSADEDTIIELIVNLLSPIGVHRKTHTSPSKGKRSKRRKAAEAKSNPSATEPPAVPIPEITSHVLIGLNVINRHLSSSAASSCPPPLQPPPSSTSEDVIMQDKEDLEGKKPQHAALVLTTRPPTSPLTTHLPLLCQAASLAYPDLPTTRLIVLPAKAEARICEALGVPRAGFVSVLDSAANVSGGGKSLIKFVNSKVEPVVVGEDWLKKAVVGYKETVIKSTQVAVPSVVKKK